MVFNVIAFDLFIIDVASLRRCVDYQWAGFGGGRPTRCLGLRLIIYSGLANGFRRFGLQRGPAVCVGFFATPRGLMLLILSCTAMVYRFERIRIVLILSAVQFSIPLLL